MGCKPDTGFKVHEDAPTATILEPGNADTFVEHTPIAFRAQLDDNDDGVDSLTVRWRSSVSGTLDGEDDLDDKVHTFVAEGLPLGIHTIVVEATDPDGNIAEDEIEVSVVENSAPQIAIVAPEADSIWADDDTVWVAVRVSDHEESAAALRLDWILDGIAVLDAVGSADDTGEGVHGFDGLDLGEHEVMVTVMDAQGDTSSATIPFTVVYGDADGDGFIAEEVGGEDCDDSQASVNPDATEVCDEIDNDCDDLIDEDDPSLDGAYVGHPDLDGDGFGAATEGLSCEAGVLVEDDTDCDDGDSAVHPDATEICNEIDDDCDGLIDGDDPQMDGDGDGHSSCDDDCDDEDSAIHPDATEVCDEIDNNCDGLIDDGTAVDALTYYLDADGDGYGTSDTTMMACTEPSSYVSDTSDCNDGDASIHPDAEEICGDGIDNDCDGLPGECKWTGDVPLDEANHVTFGEDVENRIASSLAVGDLDGDGIGDLIVGAGLADPVAVDSGAVYLMPGPLSETWGSMASHASVRLDGVSYSDYAGTTLSNSDLDDDGLDDLLIGAPQEDTAGTNNGAVYLFYGPLTDSGSLEDAHATVYGESGGDMLGGSVHSGDLNGDGIPDFGIGAQYNGTYAAQAGAVYLFMGDGSREGGSIDASDADTRIYSTQRDMEFGAGVHFAGDVNGDGRDDLLICAPRSNDGAESAGAVYLFLGHATDYEDGSSMVHVAAQAEYLGNAARDYAGSSISTLGDVDGDSRAEFAIGAPYTDAGPDRDLGTVYLMLSPDLSGSSDLEPDSDVRIRGEADDNALGFALAGNFDLDADGQIDLAISAPDERRPYTNQGVVYLLYGPLPDLPSDLMLGGDEDAAFLGEASSDHAGSVLLGGDVTDDGMDDLVLGAPGMSPAGGSVDAGAIYALFGGGI
jgi:hypothetical protein